MVYYTADRITANVPFPPDATDIVFDQHRPYLGCIAPLALDATLDFFRKEMAAIGWKPLSAADASRAVAQRGAQRDGRERRPRLLQP